MSTSVEQHRDARETAPRPRSRRTGRWLALGGVLVLLVGGGTWYVLAQQRSDAIAAANVLDPQGSTWGVLFADARDDAAVRVAADDFEEYSRTVPLRKGEPMALVLLVTNQSDLPVTVRGSTDPERLMITTATAAEDARGGAGN